jgi:crossover junction endodeoxyribonuclease RuvC
MRILGIDPGLTHTGWGVIEHTAGRLTYISSGRISAPATDEMPARLNFIFGELRRVIELYAPDAAALEQTFVNANPASALKLGQARGVAMLSPATCGLSVAEYAPNLIKKSIVGSGHAGKDQIAAMIRVLLPKSGDLTPDQADALAVAITHAHHVPYQISSSPRRRGSGDNREQPKATHVMLDPGSCSTASRVRDDRKARA